MRKEVTALILKNRDGEYYWHKVTDPDVDTLIKNLKRYEAVITPDNYIHYLMGGEHVQESLKDKDYFKEISTYITKKKQPIQTAVFTGTVIFGRNSNKSLAVLWAQKRNYTKFRIKGLAGVVSSIVQSPVLTDMERWRLADILDTLNGILEDWSFNNTKSKYNYLEGK